MKKLLTLTLMAACISPLFAAESAPANTLPPDLLKAFAQDMAKIKKTKATPNFAKMTAYEALVAMFKLSSPIAKPSELLRKPDQVYVNLQYRTNETVLATFVVQDDANSNGILGPTVVASLARPSMMLYFTQQPVSKDKDGKWFFVNQEGSRLYVGKYNNYIIAVNIGSQSYDFAFSYQMRSWYDIQL
ncbi:MAG: hypothetical protein WCS77_00745 [Elusimicrobiaceae bacterium]